MNDVFKQRRHTYQNELVNFRFNTLLLLLTYSFLDIIIGNISINKSILFNMEYTDWVKIFVYNSIYFCIYHNSFTKSWKRTEKDFLISINYNLRPLIINANIDILCESNNWGCVFSWIWFQIDRLCLFLVLIDLLYSRLFVANKDLCLYTYEICYFLMISIDNNFSKTPKQGKMLDGWKVKLFSDSLCILLFFQLRDNVFNRRNLACK